MSYQEESVKHQSPQYAIYLNSNLDIETKDAHPATYCNYFSRRIVLVTSNSTVNSLKPQGLMFERWSKFIYI
jgi:hypothetical protein